MQYFKIVKYMIQYLNAFVKYLLNNTVCSK